MIQRPHQSITLRATICLLATLSLLSACDGGGPDGTTAAAPLGPREADGALSQQRAAERSRRISAVTYGLSLTLDPALDHYAGAVDIVFQLDGADRDLTVDYVNGAVTALQVNGLPVAVDGAVYNGQFITLPASALAAGANTVVVSFESPWSTDGTGLYRFDDEEDGRTYTYTDLEPYDSHRWFPQFDQPDIKAHLQLEVSVPADWQVVANRHETSVADAGDGTRLWRFPATPIISTYLMHMSAGPYAMWEDADFRYPLRIFARQSLAEYMDAEVWFRIARAQFDFMDAYTDLPYPYLKYDQIIVPDYNAGAMENVAAVTWNEGNIERDGRDPDELIYLTMVHGHELAHMWFGDLVTPVWWDGLWLNESFAEFMGFHVASATGAEGAWEQFYSDWKSNAYRSDQRATTHALQTPVATTDNVLDNFDSLTYAKGGAVLRQLEFLVGEETFRDGLRLYLAQFAEGNARAEDLVAAIADAAGPDFPVDLEAWAHEWLYIAGVDTIRAEFSCRDGVVSAMTIHQTAPAANPTLRTQRIQVGLYRRDGAAVVTDAVVPVLISGARTELPGALGAACPDLVYPNHGDLGYALVDMDPTTRANLAAAIGDVVDPFQRLMFWVTLYDQVRSGSVPATDFLDVALAAAADEQERSVVYEVYFEMGSVLGYLQQMGDEGAAALADYGPRIEAMMWDRVMTADPSLVTLFFDRYTSALVSQAGMANLAALLDGDISVPGFTLDQGRRWTALGVLADAGYAGVEARIAAERARDPSRSGELGELALLASLPDAARKSQYLDAMFDPATEYAYSDLRTIARSLYPLGQGALLAADAVRILAQLTAWEAVAAPDTLRIASLTAATLTPAMCTDESVARLAQVVRDHADSRSLVRRQLIRVQEDDAMCVARREAMGGR